MNNKVLHDDEISKSFVFSQKLLPTNHDCLLYVISLTNKEVQQMTHMNAVWEMTRLLGDIWTAADCCPYSRKHIVTLFEKQIWDTYKYLLREKCLPGDKTVMKRSHKKETSKIKDRGEPVQKSKRITGDQPNTSTESSVVEK